MMMDEILQTFIDRIQFAFGNVSQPHADALVVATRDDEGTEEYFSGKQVECIPDEHFVRYCTALWFFTDDAFLYYLPGFMIAALRGADKCGVIWGHIHAQFADQRRPEVVAKLNDEQRSCIVEFCRCCGVTPEELAHLKHAIVE